MRERVRGYAVRRAARRPQYPGNVGIPPPVPLLYAQTTLRRISTIVNIDNNGMFLPVKAVRFNLANPSTPNSLNRTDWGNPEMYWTVTPGAAGNGPGTYLTFLRDCIVHVLYVNDRPECDCTACYGPILDDGTHPGTAGEWQRGAQYGAPTASRRTSSNGNAAPGLLSLCCHQNQGTLGQLGNDCNWLYGVRAGYRMFFIFYDDTFPQTEKDAVKAHITLIRTRTISATSFPT